jgi:hypothetical protein
MKKNQNLFKMKNNKIYFPLISACNKIIKLKNEYFFKKKIFDKKNLQEIPYYHAKISAVEIFPGNTTKQSKSVIGNNFTGNKATLCVSLNTYYIREGMGRAI